MKIKLNSESTPFQVDGEPWEQRGGEVSMERGNSVGVLQGPAWRSSSKKNARFHASLGLKVADDGSSAPSAEPITQADA